MITRERPLKACVRRHLRRFTAVRARITRKCSDGTGLRRFSVLSRKTSYVLVDDLDWGEAKRQGFEVQGGADFQDIEVVLERGGWQDGHIKVFRIDPGATAGVTAAIDYISFTGPPGTIAVAPHATLATEWGRMKSSR